MRRINVGTVLYALLVISPMALAQAPGPLRVEMKDKDGNALGIVTFAQNHSVVDVEVLMNHAPPGEHALHVHAGAACVAPGFESAGPHLNPTNKHHGFKNLDGHHAGDFPESITIAADGTGKLVFHTKDLSFDPSSPASLFGKTVVLHELADDQKTDPSGASGKRIACGIIPTLGFL